MNIKKNRKRPELRQKLRESIRTIQVDIFGYEKKVTRNIGAYFDRVSKEKGVSKKDIRVHIFKDQSNIRVHIHVQGKGIQKIPVSHLILLFINTEASGFVDLEKKVISGINTFINDYATSHQIPATKIGVHIFYTQEDDICIKGTDDTKEISKIPLKALIKHFTS